MTWTDWLDLAATILIVWVVAAILVGAVLGKSFKLSRGPDEENSDEG